LLGYHISERGLSRLAAAAALTWGQQTQAGGVADTRGCTTRGCWSLAFLHDAARSLPSPAAFACGVGAFATRMGCGKGCGPVAVGREERSARRSDEHLLWRGGERTGAPLCQAWAGWEKGRGRASFASCTGLPQWGRLWARYGGCGIIAVSQKR